MRGWQTSDWHRMGLCSCPTGRGTQGGAVPGPVSLWASVHQLLNYFHRLHQLSSFLSPGIPLASPHCHLPNRWREALCSLALRFSSGTELFLSLFLAYLAQLAGVGVELWSHPLPSSSLWHCLHPLGTSGRTRSLVTWWGRISG